MSFSETEPNDFLPIDETVVLRALPDLIARELDLSPWCRSQLEADQEGNDGDTNTINVRSRAGMGTSLRDVAVLLCDGDPDAIRETIKRDCIRNPVNQFVKKHIE